MAKIRCIIENRLQTKKGSKFSFKNLETNEEGKAITFGDFDASWLGEQAEFEAKYNEKFKNYQVVGDISILGGAVTPAQEAPVAEQVEKPKAKRSRPKIVAGASRTGKSESTEAVSIVRQNLLEAKALLEEFGPAKPADIVLVGDMIGRTKVALRIEAGKDRRMKELRK